MARRAPVRLADGRTGIITRVVTSYPEGEVHLHLWTGANDDEDGPGPTRVREATVLTVDGTLELQSA